MQTFLSFALLMLVSSSAFGADSPVISCAGKYKEKKVSHDLSLKFYQSGETFDVVVRDSIAKNDSQEWRVEVQNRFFFSRVEYYSYDPIRLRILFDSTTFARKGILMSSTFNDATPIKISCTLPKKGTR